MDRDAEQARPQRRPGRGEPWTGRWRGARLIARPPPARRSTSCVSGRRRSAGSTPPTLRYVQGATESLLGVLGAGELVVGKSTVPVGTAAGLAALVAEKVPGALLAWNPEFLREGFAVEDTLQPDRLVYGLPAGADGDTARGLLDEVYAPIVARGTPQV